MKGNDQADRHTMQSNRHRWLVAHNICSIEKLESTDCQIQVPLTAWRREAKKEEALNNKILLERQERVNRINNGTVLKETLGKLLQDGVQCI